MIRSINSPRTEREREESNGRGQSFEIWTRETFFSSSIRLTLALFILCKDCSGKNHPFRPWFSPSTNDGNTPLTSSDNWGSCCFKRWARHTTRNDVIASRRIDILSSLTSTLNWNSWRVYSQKTRAEHLQRTGRVWFVSLGVLLRETHVPLRHAFDIDDRFQSMDDLHQRLLIGHHRGQVLEETRVPIPSVILLFVFTLYACGASSLSAALVSLTMPFIACSKSSWDIRFIA